jgi:hypothetical protein
MEGRECMGNRLAGAAATILTHMLGDEPLPGNDIERFGDILANLTNAL